MKRILFYFSFLFILSCQKDNPGINYAYITGHDLRMCACCGGYYIQIDDIQYRFYELPENSSINLNEVTFPLKVIVSWEMSEDLCLGDEIIIKSIQK
jgi:hypothetical protein